MSKTAKILALAGSARRGSFNQQLLELLTVGARQAGAEVTVLDMRALSLPLFNQDLEEAQGLPAEVRDLQQRFREHDGLLIASPEHNSSVTALLKNLIDWVSRAVPGAGGAPALASFSGKVAVLASASPGGLGGLRGLVHLRSILGNVGVIVLPEQLAVSRAHEAFAEDGSLRDAKQQAGALALGRRLAEFLRQLNG
jgi:NAD(P)H-dependent FMN reductase